MHGSLTPDGHGDYISTHQPSSPSPAYTVASAARRLMEQGHTLTLPDGYNLDSIKSMTWWLGYYDTPVRITARHHQELLDIARELHNNHNTDLHADERTAIGRLLLNT